MRGSRVAKRPRAGRCNLANVTSSKLLRLRAFLIAVSALAAFVTCRTYDITYTDDGGACTPPRVTLSCGCVDPTTDRANCGGCGNVCPPNDLCQASSCVPCTPSTDTPCGTAGGTFCTDLTTDDSNCGACGTRCAHGEHCVASQCKCSLTLCGTDCVDTQTDVSHCGSCTTPCGPPDPNESSICSGGMCGEQCIAPFADCDGMASNGCEANLETDSANCGVCKRSCNGGACTSGACPVTTYASGGNLLSLAVDPTFVYWADDSTAGAIFKKPISAGSVSTVYATNAALFIAVDPTRIVWMNTLQLDSRLLSGGTVSALDPQVPVSFALAGGIVYFSTNDARLWRVPSDASANATQITSGSFAAFWIAVDATNVYYSDTGGNIFYVSETATNVVATKLAMGVGAVALAIDTSNVYYSTSNNTIVAQAKGSSTSTVLAKAQQGPGPIATDGTSVYWGNADGSINRVPVGGGVVVPLVRPSTVDGGVKGSPFQIVVDSMNVYWVGPTSVSSTPK
jgi:hypothetical protein